MRYGIISNGLAEATALLYSGGDGNNHIFGIEKSSKFPQRAASASGSNGDGANFPDCNITTLSTGIGEGEIKTSNNDVSDDGSNEHVDNDRNKLEDQDGQITDIEGSKRKFYWKVMWTAPLLPSVVLSQLSGLQGDYLSLFFIIADLLLELIAHWRIQTQYHTKFESA